MPKLKSQQWMEPAAPVDAPPQDTDSLSPMVADGEPESPPQGLSTDELVLVIKQLLNIAEWALERGHIPGETQREIIRQRCQRARSFLKSLEP